MVIPIVLEQKKAAENSMAGTQSQLQNLNAKVKQCLIFEAMSTSSLPSFVNIHQAVLYKWHTMFSQNYSV